MQKHYKCELSKINTFVYVFRTRCYVLRISSSYASSFMKQFKLKDRNITTEKDTMKNEKENLLGKVTL